ncbi:MAG TPA: TonB family protein [Bryobacteraceae bacterium]
MAGETAFVGMAVKGSAVLIAAWLMSRLLRRTSAAVRHLIWTAAFAALLALPVLSALVPALPLRAPLVVPTLVFQTGAQPAADVGGARPTAAPSRPEAPRTSSWLQWFVFLWAAGTGVSLAQMLVNWIGVARIRREARPCTSADLPALAHTLGIGGHVELLEARAGTMPMATGVFRPAVLLPADAGAWTAERRRVVLLHELAHIRRGDLIAHLIGRIAVSLYWWNPLAWAAWREFLEQRERAADDLVLSAGARPSDYAAHLLEIARSLRVSPELGSAALAMARRSQLEGRLVAILDSRVNRNAPRRATAALAMLFALAAVAPFAAIQAQDRSATLPADADATIRAATAQKNHEMLESAAKAAEVLQQYDLARRLLDSALDIRAAESSAQSVSYGVGLIRLGDLERSRGNSTEANAFYTKAVSILGNRPEAAPPLVKLGVSTWASTKDPAQALSYFQRAQAADPAHAGTATTWMALTQARPADAEALFKQALSMEEIGSAEAALTMDLYSAFLNRQNRPDDAKSLQDNARSIRVALGAQAVVVRRGSGEPAVRIGGGVTAPRLLSKMEPRYSEEARLAKYQGTVVVAVDVGTDGLAQNMRVVRGLGLGLDEEALKAIGQWKFQPGAKNGEAVPVQATIEVNFRLL